MKKISSFLLALLLILPMSHAGATGRESIVVYGAGLSKEERAKTREFFDVKNERVGILKADEYREIIKEAKTRDENLISSVAVSFDESMKGIQVSIKTSDNITKVTSGQYINAVYTAGLDKCLIEVAAIKKVSGHSALAGVFKVAKMKGIKLNKENVKLANEELRILSEVSNSSKGQKNFSDDNFSAAIAEIKKEIARLSKENGKDKVTDEKINNVVVNIFNQFNIKISDINMDKINNYMIKFRDNLGNIDIDSFVKNTGNIIENLKNAASDGGKFIQEKTEELKKKAGELKEAGEKNGFFQAIGNFFKAIFTAISDLFKSLVRIFTGEKAEKTAKFNIDIYRLS